MAQSRPFIWVGAFVVLAALVWLGKNADPQAAQISRASGDGLKAIERMQVPSGLKAELWAAEPMLANPVSFCIDEQGRIYVAETFRLMQGVTDDRYNMQWLDDEIANRTVADRVAMYKKFNYHAAGQPDRVRVLYSTSGAGKPNRSRIFASGFNRAEDGLGAGLLAHRGNVYFTCIPDLWLLKDTRGTNVADFKKSLHTGYGIHVSMFGHDLHGLKLGPDGKLYFSIGDRGLHVETEGRVVSAPDCGAVLRCNLDGSQLELVHTGLRNPQEIAFDKFGNLFTVDNNADGGDQARLVHVIDGGDSGWHIGHQYLPGLSTWIDEKTWQPNNPNRSAFFLPPLANLANGPAGLTYHPGVAQLPEKYRDTFFLCDFRGAFGNSGIHAITLKPNGATFDLDKRENFVWQTLATDCDFGPDGAFYISDWVEGWRLTGKGRIYRVADPKKASDPLVESTQRLIASGMGERGVAEIARLLSHEDMRVRLEAQYTLAEREAQAELEAVARDGQSLLGRLHAIWGLGQLGRKVPRSVRSVVALLEDPEVEVRASAAKVLGENKHTAAAATLVKMLKDDSARVRLHAAQALGRTGSVADVPALLSALEANADADPYLRHVLVGALASIADSAPELVKANSHPNVSVRLGALLALRKLERPECVLFLGDADPKIMLEAARAIYDTPILQALPAVANLLERSLPDSKVAEAKEYMLRRAAAAHWRFGQTSDAAALVAFAAGSDMPEKVRRETVQLLQQWHKPSNRDPIVGLWRPLAERSNEPVIQAVQPALQKLLSGPDSVCLESAKLAAQLDIKDAGPFLRTLATDRARSAGLRFESLKALITLKDSGLKETAEAVMKDPDGRMRHLARRALFATADADAVVAELSSVLEDATVSEKQGALDWLADLKKAPADAVILRWIDRLAKKDAPPEIHLDIIEAAIRRKSEAAVDKALNAYVSSRPKEDELGKVRASLYGGDSEAGRKLFHDRTDLACLRCHKIKGAGGDVGPDLADLSKRVNREYILESLALPNKQIAKGYETVVLVLTSGQVKTGVLKSEDAKEVRLVNADGQLVTVPKASIEERSSGPSAMPGDLTQKINRRELRDLVEYLSGL